MESQSEKNEGQKESHQESFILGVDMEGKNRRGYWKTEEDYLLWVSKQLFRQFVGTELSIPPIKNFEGVVDFITQCIQLYIESIDTKPEKEDNHEDCFVYWIRCDDHADIHSQGYVGVSKDPNMRIYQHISRAKLGNYIEYHKDFQTCLLGGNYVLDLVDSGSYEYCFKRERYFRPYPYIAWNKSAGGGGGDNYKHGLTGTKVAKTYFNLRNRAKVSGKAFEPRWGGVEDFLDFYLEWENIEGNFTLRDTSGEYTKDNIIKMPMKEIINRAKRVHELCGEYYSVNDLGEKFNLPPNRISGRLRDGWTLREAVELDARK